MNDFIETIRQTVELLPVVGCGKFKFFVPEYNNGRYHTHAHAIAPDDSLIYFYHYETHRKPEKQRISISGKYPHDKDNYQHYPHKEDRAGITVALNRTPASIAADIARRFWPVYYGQYQIALQSVAAANLRYERMQQTKKTLFELCDGKAGHDERLVYGNHWRAEVSSDGIYKLEFTKFQPGIDMETAIDMIRLFQGKSPA